MFLTRSRIWNRIVKGGHAYDKNGRTRKLPFSAIENGRTQNLSFLAIEVREEWYITKPARILSLSTRQAHMHTRARVRRAISNSALRTTAGGYTLRVMIRSYDKNTTTQNR